MLLMATFILSKETQTVTLQLHVHNEVLPSDKHSLNWHRVTRNGAERKSHYRIIQPISHPRVGISYQSVDNTSTKMPSLVSIAGTIIPSCPLTSPILHNLVQLLCPDSPQTPRLHKGPSSSPQQGRPDSQLLPSKVPSTAYRFWHSMPPSFRRRKYDATICLWFSASHG